MSSLGKLITWYDYTAVCTALEKQSVSYSKFKDFWQQLHPNVVVAKPMTDLWMTCQQNTATLVRSANLQEGEKSECVRAQQEHLNIVKSERELYKEVCEEAKNIFETVELPWRRRKRR